MALLAVGQLHVKLFKAALSSDFALFQVTQLRFNVAHVKVNLFAARTGLFGQLRQAQHFHLQLVRTALTFGGFAPGCAQALGCIRIR